MGQFAGKVIKNALLIASALFFCASCTDSSKKEEPKSAREIMHTYTETLAKSPQKAKEAAALAEKRNEQEEKAIKELEK